MAKQKPRYRVVMDPETGKRVGGTLLSEKGILGKAYEKVGGGKGLLKGGGLALGGLLTAKWLSNLLEEKGHREAQVQAIEGLPDITPEDLLRESRQTELNAIRRARLARTDPEAFAILQAMVSGEEPSPTLATGEFLVGRQPRASRNADLQIEELLAALGG